MTYDGGHFSQEMDSVYLLGVPDITDVPLLESWTLLFDGTYRGRVYGREGAEDGDWIETSFVPPEHRDMRSRLVWTESGNA